MLITSKTDISKYVYNSVSYEKLEEFIKQAEINYIIPVLGKEQYEELDNYHNESGSGSGSGDPKLAVLLEYTQRPLVNLAHWIFIPSGSVQLGDGGIRRTETDNLKTAFHYQEINLAKSFKNAGWYLLILSHI